MTNADEQYRRGAELRARLLAERYPPGQRVMMAVDWAKTLPQGALGTVIESQGPGGYIDVRWDDGQIRGHSEEMLQRVPLVVGRP